VRLGKGKHHPGHTRRGSTASDVPRCRAQRPSRDSPAITEPNKGVKDKILMEKPTIYRKNREMKARGTQDCR